MREYLKNIKLGGALWIAAFLSLFTSNAWGQATLPFSFDGGKSDVASTTGLSHKGLGSDYTDSPHLKFDGTGDYLILQYSGEAAELSYTIKFNGSGTFGTFEVQESADGSTYTSLKSYSSSVTWNGNGTQESNISLSSDTRYIKWIYTEKTDGNVALGAISVSKKNACAAPTFSPASGTKFTTSLDVTLSCTTEGAAIYYTTDGSTPTSSTSSKYDGNAITLTQETTINAIAYADGLDASDVATASYVKGVETPEISPSGGTYASAQTIKITCATEGAAVYYTTDGSTPTSSTGNVYDDNTGITLSQDATLQAIAVKDGLTSEVATATYSFVSSSLTGNGTFENPYTVSDVQALKEESARPSDNVWVKGYIAGTWKGTEQLDTDNSTQSNVVLADNAGETDTSKHFPVQLSSDKSNAKFRAITNVKDNSSNIGKLVYVYGSVKDDYFKVAGMKSTSKVYGLSEQLTVTTEGYGTYYNSCAYEMPEGLEGGTITQTTASTDGTGGTLTINYKYTGGETVPSGTSLLIKGAAGKYGIVNTNSTTATVTGNLLHGGDALSGGKTSVAASDGGTVRYYILSHDKQGENLGFYWSAADGAAITYQAPYAFLAIETNDATEAAPMRFFLTDMVTGIPTTRRVPAPNTAIYTLTGIRVPATEAQNLPAGLYIIGGKKVLVK